MAKRKGPMDGIMELAVLLIATTIIMTMVAVQIADPDTDATLKLVYGFFGGILGIGLLWKAWNAVTT